LLTVCNLFKKISQDNSLSFLSETLFDPTCFLLSLIHRTSVPVFPLIPNSSLQKSLKALPKDPIQQIHRGLSSFLNAEFLCFFTLTKTSPTNILTHLSEPSPIIIITSIFSAEPIHRLQLPNQATMNYTSVSLPSGEMVCENSIGRDAYLKMLRSDSPSFPCPICEPFIQDLLLC
jgi:hypothetical protein